MKDTKESVVVSGWRSKAVDDVLASLLPVVAKSAEGRQGVAEAQKSKIERGAKDIIEENVHFPCLTKPALQQRSLRFQSLDVPHTSITRSVNVTTLYVLCATSFILLEIHCPRHPFPIAYRAIAIATFA